MGELYGEGTIFMQVFLTDKHPGLPNGYVRSGIIRISVI